MTKIAKIVKKLTPETPEVEVPVATEKRDKDFYKRHPGALDGVIYE